MRLFVTAALALSAAAVAAAPAAGRAAHSQDAGAILAAARTALGGDALLNSINSFTVNGSLTEDHGPARLGSSIEISVELPDKYVMMSRRHMDYPGGGFTITKYDGFNGRAAIDATLAPGAPMPMVIPGPPPRTAAEAQAREETRLRLKQRHFMRLMLPLFGASPAVAPVQFTSAGNFLKGTTTDGWTFGLYFDAATNRPLKLTWMDLPIIMMSRTSTVTTTSRGEVVSQSPPMGPLPADPTVGVAPVEWELALSDYKTEAGLTWPHRFITSTAGKKTGDMRLGKYRINVPIKPHVFDPKK